MKLILMKKQSKYHVPGEARLVCDFPDTQS